MVIVKEAPSQKLPIYPPTSYVHHIHLVYFFYFWIPFIFTFFTFNILFLINGYRPQPLTRLSPHKKDFGDLFSALIDHDTKRWRRDRLERIFLPFEDETILNIPISYHAQEDQLIWVGNKNGTFTVKSAYYVARKILEGNSRENHLLEK